MTRSRSRIIRDLIVEFLLIIVFGGILYRYGSSSDHWLMRFSPFIGIMLILLCGILFWVIRRTGGAN